MVQDISQGIAKTLSSIVNLLAALLWDVMAFHFIQVAGVCTCNLFLSHVFLTLRLSYG
jgi:hypothetical protein